MTPTRRALVAAFVLVMGAVGEGQAPVNVTGRWRASITFDHGPVNGTFELKQDAGSVTGRFTAGFTGGDVPVEGELTGRNLTLSGATTAGPHPGAHLDFSLELKPGDTLAGTLAWEPGEFALTAVRDK